MASSSFDMEPASRPKPKGAPNSIEEGDVVGQGTTRSAHQATGSGPKGTESAPRPSVATVGLRATGAAVWGAETTEEERAGLEVPDPASRAPDPAGRPHHLTGDAGDRGEGGRGRCEGGAGREGAAGDAFVSAPLRAAAAARRAVTAAGEGVVALWSWAAGEVAPESSVRGALGGREGLS